MVTENKDISTFFLAFVGQKVTITTNLMVTTIAGVDSEGVPIMETVPLFYEGILLDYDEENFFLGKGPEEITQAVHKSAYKHIMTTDNEDLFDEILTNMPEPNKDDIN